MSPKSLHKYICCFFLLFCWLNQTAQSIVINEFASKNQTVLADFENDFPDWIELYNGTDEAVNLSDYSIKDESNGEWIFPTGTIIEGKGFLVIFASNKDGVFNGELHTNFAISSSGESLYLFDAANNLIDETVAVPLEADISYARIIDGQNNWYACAVTTPELSNSGNLPLYNLQFSHQPGQYHEPFQLTVSNDGDLAVYYTTDGSLPSDKALLYTDSIYLDDLAESPNINSLVPSAIIPYEPIGLTNKINTLRLAGFIDGQQVTPVYTQTYMIEPDAERYQLPILSIVTEPKNIFDDTSGIYVLGYLFESTQIPNFNGRGREWERPTHLEFFNSSGTLEWSQNCGIRMHGNGSRKERQKSFRLYGRNSYGNEYLDHPIFPDKSNEKYKHLILRTIQSSYNNTFFADELGSQSIANTDIGRQAFRLTILFINGEYWGVYSIKERQDEHYIEENYEIDKDSIDLLHIMPEFALAGDGTHYENLLTFIEENDLNIQENYEYVQTQMDVADYIDYLIAEFYFANIDWPYNNISFWRPKTEIGKWQWLLQDIDFGFNIYWRESITYFLNNTADENPEWATFLGQSLLENEAFKNQFIERFEYHLNHTFSRDTMIEHINQFYLKISPHLQEHLDRYNYAGEPFTFSYEDWIAQLNSLYYYVAARPCSIKEQILQNFDISIEIPPCDVLPFDPTSIQDTTNLPIDTTDLPIDTTETNTTFIPLNEKTKFQITVVERKLHITCLACTETKHQLKITNLNGQVIAEQDFQFHNNNYQLSLNHLPVGLYLICINNQLESTCQIIPLK